MGFKKSIGVIGLIGLIGLLGVSRSSAQTASPVAPAVNTQVIITWQADNYFPADFEGRSLPAPYTPVVASVELLQNATLTDLSQATISWYVDDKFQNSGVGLKTFSFYAQQEDFGYASLRVRVQTQDGASFQNSIQIPVTHPQLILQYPSPLNTVPANSNAIITAVPFSFNISSLSDLTYYWTVNGVRATSTGSSVTLNVGTPQTAYDTLLQISVSAQNNNNPLEIAKTAAAFSIQ